MLLLIFLLEVRDVKLVIVISIRTLVLNGLLKSVISIILIRGTSVLE